jgi:flavorubredoxin
MNALKAKDNVWWVGVCDPDIRIFDIIMHTDYGTSYNAYIVKGSEKTVLFETVKPKFFEQHLEKIRSVCDPNEIDYIVLNHTEPDHSGSVEKLLEYATHAEVISTNTGINFLKEIINKPFPNRVATQEDTLDLGGMTLQFIHTPMLHWPDAMYTYIKELKALFTCDSFGCHYSDERVFNHLIEGDFYEAYKYYFDNIMGPYKNPHMQNALKKIENLDIEFIGNGHGPVLTTDIKKYIDLYKKWSLPVKNKEPKAVICYVSSYGYTKSLAFKIKEGMFSSGIKNIKLYDLVYDDMKQAQADVADSDGFLLGSPTMVGDALPPAYQVMIGLNPIIHKGKYAGAFGSYAWSGEAVPNLISRMKQLNFKIPFDGFKVKLKPSDAQLSEAYEYGVEFAKNLLENFNN